MHGADDHGFEVKSWFENFSQAHLSHAQYSDIAVCLTKWRWPSDQPDAGGSPSIDTDSDPESWWDFRGASDSAKMLLDSIPAMLSHWEGLRGAPQTRDGYEAIRSLEAALSIAMPYIEWPFGKYERRKGPKRPKAWHLPAVLIAQVIINAMVKAGNNSPGISRNSVVVRVVRKALKSNGIPRSENGHAHRDWSPFDALG